MYLINGYYYENFPILKNRNSNMLDLANGPYFINLIDLINQTGNYYTIDKSHFVKYILLYKLKLNQKENIFPIVADVTQFWHSNEMKYSIIRAKNNFRYIENLYITALEYSNFIVANGSFYFQETSCINSFKQLIQNNLFTNFCFNLINKGFTVDYKAGDKQNPLSLDSLIFSKVMIDIKYEENKMNDIIDYLNK